MALAKELFPAEWESIVDRLGNLSLGQSEEIYRLTLSAELADLFHDATERREAVQAKIRESESGMEGPDDGRPRVRRRRPTMPAKGPETPPKPKRRAGLNASQYRALSLLTQRGALNDRDIPRLGMQRRTFRGLVNLGFASYANRKWLPTARGVVKV